MHGALNAVAKLEAERAAMVAAGHFSNKGIRDEARKFALAHTIAPLHSASKTVEDVRAHIARARAQLGTPPSDPGDATGQLRGEMRAWLRTLGPGQVMATLLDEKVDRRLILAVLEAPAGMSGLTGEMLEEVRKQTTTRIHGPEMERLEQLEEAAALLEAAVTTSLYQLRQETDFSENHMIEFDKWMEAATANMEAEPVHPSIAANQPAAASTGHGSGFNIEEELDKIWAEHFPELYPDHPVNRGKVRA